jgi:16S rRNA (cytosine1402-N4)-methyltransferase
MGRPAEEPRHIPVLYAEALAALAIRPDGIYVDGTAGGGSHALGIARQLRGGRLLALDRDGSAVARVRERLAGYPQASVHQANYGELDSVLRAEGVDAIDGLLIDAGLSSFQLDDPERGFSFQEAGPLDMRMDARDESAQRYLRRVPERELAQVLRDFGDVKPAKRIAKAICQRRGAGGLETTQDLVATVGEALPFVEGTPIEVRTVFQAVRMAVNKELQWLDAGIRQAADWLKPGGRLAVISFHSGEDRVVKRIFRDASRVERVLRPDGRVARVIAPRLRMVTRKPILPGEGEIRSNPRAKSAKLRVAERLPEEE